MPDTLTPLDDAWEALRRNAHDPTTFAFYAERVEAAVIAAHLDALTAAARLVDAGWMATDEGENVRLRYASDLPARLLTLRKVLDGTYEEPHDA